MRRRYRRELARLASEEANVAQSAPVSGSAGAPILELDARIDSMRRTLHGLLLKYTDGHPDVVGVRRVLTELEEQKRQLMASRKSEGALLPQAVAGEALVHTSYLKVSLARAEANAASLRTRVAEYLERYSLSLSPSIRQQNMSAVWAHKLSPLFSITLIASQLRTEGLSAPGLDTRQRLQSLLFSTQTGARTRAFIGVSQSYSDRQTGGGFRENALAGALTMSF